jgi:hypothetical protein
MGPEPQPADATLPDYAGGSIVNLMASIREALGGPPGVYPGLSVLPSGALRGSRSIVLLVIDGMGESFLRRAGSRSVLAAHLCGGMTSVFPSTTATAVTAFLTGVAPQQHGLVGWFTYLKEVGGLVAVLPFRTRAGGSLRQCGIEPARIFSAPSFFDSLPVPGFAVSPREIANSDFNVLHSGNALRRGYGNFAEMFEAIRSIVTAGRKPQYVYAYYSELDALAHVFGIDSPQVTGLMMTLDRAFGQFLKSIAGSDTTVIVTADHGFTDVRPENNIDLDRHPRLAECLVLPLSGERRVAFCYVHPDRLQAFEAYVHGPLGHCARAYPSRQLLDGGWFGLGEAHPRLADRIGHYTLVMNDGYAIKDWILGERRHLHIGHHGGLSRDEMRVPLVVARA